jgi:riboflavin synthase
MFTGIIEAIGRVQAVQRRGDLLYLTIAPQPQAALTDMKAGDSICVSGACLTVTALSREGFQTDVSSETQERTTLGSLKTHDEVNLERALQVSDRLGGHLVTGHVDGTGYVTEVTKGAGSLVMTIRVPHELASYIVEKGSVAVEGVSLTTNRIAGDEFQVVIIPYTAQNTTLGKKRAGDRVNIEVDLIGKYVRRFMQQGRAGIDKGFLAEHGFDRE